MTTSKKIIKLHKKIINNYDKFSTRQIIDIGNKLDEMILKTDLILDRIRKDQKTKYIQAKVKKNEK